MAISKFILNEFVGYWVVGTSDSRHGPLWSEAHDVSMLSTHSARHDRELSCVAAVCIANQHRQAATAPLALRTTSHRHPARSPVVWANPDENRKYLNII